MPVATEIADLGPALDLVSSKVGVIRSLSAVQRGADEPDPPVIYQAMLAHFDFRKGKSWERVAVGKGLTDLEAARGAIGEAVERYCASHFDLAATRRATWSALEPDALCPRDFVLYSDTQHSQTGFPHRKWNLDDEIRWVTATELPSGRQVLAPATLVYMSLQDVQPQDLFCAPTSNGLAAGPNLEFAILHSLCEVIERDGFLITWMNRLPAPEVIFSGGTGVATSIRDHYSSLGVEVRVFNISTNLPGYVMMAVAVDRSGNGPAALVGLGCDLNPTAALTKALFELCQIRPGEVQRCQRDRPSDQLRSYKDVHTLEDHSAFFHPPERLAEFSFLLDNGRTQSFEDLPDRTSGTVSGDLEYCVNSLTAAGLRVYYVNLTTPDIAPYGFYVARVLATDLQPMHFGYGEERLGGHRLYEVPKLLGYIDMKRSEQDLNPCPHPLA